MDHPRPHCYCKRSCIFLESTGTQAVQRPMPPPRWKDTYFHPSPPSPASGSEPNGLVKTRAISVCDPSAGPQPSLNYVGCTLAYAEPLTVLRALPILIANIARVRDLLARNNTRIVPMYPDMRHWVDGTKLCSVYCGKRIKYSTTVKRLYFLSP